jgi:protein-disulfide isomerase
MLCFVALAVLSFLSLFSAKYRPLAAKAFDCVARKATLRPCETGFDEEMKAKSLAEIMKISPKAAVFASRHFEILSFAFSGLFIISLALTLQGLANFVVYGNCNGPEGGFCIYSGLQNKEFLKAPGSLEGIAIGSPSANVTVIEFGCYSCPYTKQAEDGVKRIISRYQGRVYFVFKPFPLPSHPYSYESALAASCANEEGKYWEYREALFGNQSEVAKKGEEKLFEIARSLNISGFDACFASKKFEAFIKRTQKEGQDCGIYGTPTFFVNGKAFVGQNSASEAEEEIRRLLGG